VKAGGEKLASAHCVSSPKMGAGLRASGLFCLWARGHSVPTCGVFHHGNWLHPRAEGIEGLCQQGESAIPSSLLHSPCWPVTRCKPHSGIRTPGDGSHPPAICLPRGFIQKMGNLFAFSPLNQETPFEGRGQDGSSPRNRCWVMAEED
jgi:hypothetical protein